MPTITPDRGSFKALNVSADAIPEWMGSFVLSAPPNTDLWRKPPTGDTSTAPILYTSLRHPFVSAEVLVSSDWRMEWDQAGLVIFAGGRPPGRTIATPPGRTTSTSASAPTATVPVDDTAQPAPPAYEPPLASKWVKVGLEFCNNTCHASSVCATQDGADWSISALPPYQANRQDLRIKFERIGYALWIYYEDQLLGWKKLREVTWFFWGVENKSVRVGVYASRPANFAPTQYERDHGGPTITQSSLRVEFDDLQIF
jgi:regulation of enolase protein 1 (concanavalin A-like superfamily)